MKSPKCPFCNKLQKNKPLKSWAYGKIIIKKTDKGTVWGKSIECSRYHCQCGKIFNYYVSSKDKSWTIPKKIKK